MCLKNEFQLDSPDDLIKISHHDTRALQLQTQLHYNRKLEHV
jgi:hypothetical protein